MPSIPTEIAYSLRFQVFVHIVFLFITGGTLAAQTNDDAVFETAIDSVMAFRPKTYAPLEDLFGSYDSDSLKMVTLLQKSRSTRYIEGQCYALNSLGIIYRNISHYDKAVDAHRKAYELSLTIANIEFQVWSLNMIGVVYRRMDLVKSALDNHKKALDLANTEPNPTKALKANIAISQNSMGNIYLTLRQYNLAINEFEKSLQLEKEANNRLGLAINYQNLGYADEAMGKLDHALKNYKRSLDYNDQIGSEVGRVICYNSIGQVYIKQKKYNDAKIIIEEALKKAIVVNDQFYIASSYINMGWAQLETKTFRDAEKSLQNGLSIAENYGLKSAIVEASSKLSELYGKTGDFEKALRHYKKATELEKQIFSERNVQYVNDIIIQSENEAKNIKIKELAIENALVKSKLERNQRLFWLTLIGLAVLAGLVVAFNRNQQLRQEKQILTLEQDMLRSQMNPHFIFNSLNSIKLYIINNEKENAVYYLNKFSKFIRKILIASTEKDMNLEDELETMRLYMNIENIRFSNEIDFEVIVEKGVNLANIRVPSLIMQPFLENALWHGLSSKKGDKKIVLEVTKSSDYYVTITITDNGIGRKASEKINNSKMTKRKSVGIGITKARLAYFSKDYLGDSKLTFEDLHDDHGKASGTKVILTIPVRPSALKIA
ncbi:MAG TPA: tetratricopeptide repeat protein [Aquaticitalea sp.]|nr:tetratricopeptide repeat protein [Aquaticitalea sp.]